MAMPAKPPSRQRCHFFCWDQGFMSSYVLSAGGLMAGSGLFGGLPPPQALASVPLVQPATGFPQVPVPTQVIAPLAQPASSRQAVGLVLSPDCPPIPAKLVERALSGQFMEMRDFLVDNVKLLDNLESAHVTAGLQASTLSRPRAREVASPLAWIHCFLAYVAIRCRDPLTRDMLAYARLILGEAMSHGGTGWLEYDRAARQQRAIDPSKPWNVLDPGLHSAFILSRSSSAYIKRCSLCQGVDHIASQCALASLDSFQGQGGAETRRRSFICQSWNRGSCSFPGTCNYRHVCSSCAGNHKAKDCPAPKGAPAPARSRRGQQSPPKH